MKILWVPHAPWKVKQRAKYLVQYLTEHHELHVLTWDAIEQLGDLRNASRVVSTLTLSKVITQNGIVIHDTIQIPGGSFLRYLRVINERNLKRSITEIVTECDIDLLVASSPMPIPDRLNIPIIGDFIDEHASYWRDVRRRSDLAVEIERGERLLAARADRHVVVSNALGKKLSTWGHSAEYIPNGFDIGRVLGGHRANFRGSLGLGEHALLIGYIGHFGEFSGLVRAVESAGDWQQDIHLVVAGDGPQMKAAKQLAVKNNLSNVHFLGWIENTKDFFAGIDVGLLPFDVVDFTSWACPIKLLEYLGAGKPVISTTLEEVWNMNLDGVIMVEPTVTGITSGVNKLQAQELPNVTLKNFQRYEWSRLASQFAAVIESVS